MLAASKTVLFPGRNYLLTNRCRSHDTLIIALAGTLAIIKVLDHQHQWLAGGYDLAIGHL